MPFYKHGQKLGWEQPIEYEVPGTGVDIVLTDLGVTANSYGQKIVDPGTIIAKITGSNFSTYLQGVVRVSGPSYGPGSDVAYGVLSHVADLTHGNKMVHLVRWGKVRESFCKDAGTIGTVSTTTKSNLPNIEWV